MRKPQSSVSVVILNRCICACIEQSLYHCRRSPYNSRKEWRLSLFAFGIHIGAGANQSIDCICVTPRTNNVQRRISEASSLVNISDFPEEKFRSRPNRFKYFVKILHGHLQYR